MAEGEKEKHPRKIYCLTIIATISGFLFGYDTGIINGALILIDGQYHVSTAVAQAIVASTVVAAAVFSLFAGLAADAFGRRKVIMASAVIFTVGAIIMAAAQGPGVIITGRAIVGAAIGFVSAVVPIYISECAPNSIRGQLITMQQLFITIGIVVSAVFAGLFQGVDDGWRAMLGLGAAPGVFQFLFFLTLPESPRYHLMKNQIAMAEQTLRQIRKKDDVQEELLEMKRQIEEEKERKDSAVCKRVFKTPHVRKALFVGCMLQLFQQFCGINAVIYYSATILQSAGFSRELAIWLACVPASINFLATFIGLWAVESLGRKLVLAISFLAIGAALLVLFTGFLLSEVNSPEAKPSNDVISFCSEHGTCHECIRDENCGYCYKDVDGMAMNGSCVRSSLTDIYGLEGRCAQVKLVMRNHEFTYNSEFCPTEYSWLAVFGMILYVLGFAPGAGPMPWTINAEIYPQWGRSVANSLATFTNWFCNGVLSFTFLTLVEAMTPWGVFLLFCGICIVAAIFVFIFVPETKDKSLEEVEMLFMSEKVRNETIKMRKEKEEEIAAAKILAMQEQNDAEAGKYTDPSASEFGHSGASHA